MIVGLYIIKNKPDAADNTGLLMGDMGNRTIEVPGGVVGFDFNRRQPLSQIKRMAALQSECQCLHG